MVAGRRRIAGVGELLTASVDANAGLRHRAGVIRALALVALFVACRPGLDEERREDLESLCASYCPDRIACVGDGWAKDDVDVCTQMCVREERYLIKNECGEASFAVLECMASLACEALPAAVVGLAGDGSAACHDEQAAQREACSLQIVR